jgi:hypothetical protein
LKKWAFPGRLYHIVIGAQALNLISNWPLAHAKYARAAIKSEAFQWSKMPPAAEPLPARAGGEHKPHSKWREFSYASLTK